MVASAPPPIRRLRYSRQSTGKRIGPTVRDLLWFQALRRHGPLPSNFLLALTRESHRNDTRTFERLGDLYHEANTPHGGPYLDRPVAQWSALSKFQHTVYDLAPAAEQALHERRIRDGVGNGAEGTYHHRLMVACVTASIELAVKHSVGLRFIAKDEILARSPHRSISIQCRVSHTNTRTGGCQVLDRPLIPDALFGIEYSGLRGRLYRFFMVEADRNKEPVRRADLRETSYLRKVLQYREAIGRGLYRQHFGMKAPMLLLTITTNARHLANIKRMVGEVFGESGCPYLLFGSFPQFGDLLTVPSPCPELLGGAWERVGYPPMRIDEAG